MCRRVWPVVLVALLAGCNGLTLGASTPTATPAPVPSDTTPAPGARQLAPGIAEFGVVNASAVAAAHERAIQGRSYVWVERRNAVPVGNNATRRWTVERTVTVENRTRFRERSTRTLHRESGPAQLLRSQSAFVTDRVVHERLKTYGGDAQYWSHPTDQTSEQFARDASGTVRRYLSVVESSVTVTQYEGQRVYLVRGRGLEMDVTFPVLNYTVRAYVTEAGVVQSLTASFAVGNAGPSRRFRYHFEYREIGTATVRRPEWVSSATAEGNATGRNQTADRRQADGGGA